MTDIEMQVRLEFMRHIWREWLKTANLAPLMVNQPNVAYSWHMDSTWIAWKCLIDTNRPQALMTAKALSAYLGKMVNDFYLLAVNTMDAVMAEYQRLCQVSIDINGKIAVLEPKAYDGSISYSEQMQLNAYMFQLSQVQAKAQKCAYVLSWRRFCIDDAMKRGECLLFKVETF